MDRDKIEKQLLAGFPRVISPLTEKHIPFINQHKDGRFGFSYSAFLLYGHGNSEGFTSSLHPQGFIYSTNGMIAGIGLFKNELYPDRPCIHIIAPCGDNWREELNYLKRRIKGLIPTSIVFARHLEPYQKAFLLEDGWDNPELFPWLKQAPEEDETYKGGVLNLNNMLNFHTARVNKTSMATDTYRSIENRFPNFQLRNLQRRGLWVDYVLEPYFSNEHRRDAEEVVSKHFDSLEGKLVGSKASDYLNLIEHIPHAANRDVIHSYVGYLYINHNNACTEKKPVSFFVFEDINRPGTEKLAGGYCTITRRESGIAEQLGLDSAGFSALTTRALYEVSRKLYYDKGITKLNLGGSENETMHLLKIKLGMEDRTREGGGWAIGA